VSLNLFKISSTCFPVDNKVVFFFCNKLSLANRLGSNQVSNGGVRVSSKTIMLAVSRGLCDHTFFFH
jgi:hypothetical protein